MADDWMKCLEDDLSCPICLELLQIPACLPCGHAFCFRCATISLKVRRRCPLCNVSVSEVSKLKRNMKLTNLLQRFKSLSAENSLEFPHCTLCSAEVKVAKEVCLRCKVPCCNTHIETHLLQQPKSVEHFMVDAEEVHSWTCLKHNEYRLYHCERKNTAVCRLCCLERAFYCYHVDIEERQKKMRKTLRKQQDRIGEQEAALTKQQHRLELLREYVENESEQLKQCVCEHYKRMHHLMNKDLEMNLQALEVDHTRLDQEKSKQDLQLNKQQPKNPQKAREVVSAPPETSNKANIISHKKRFVKIFKHKSQPSEAAHPESAFLSKAKKKQKDIEKMLEEHITPPIYETHHLDRRFNIQRAFRNLRMNLKKFNSNFNPTPHMLSMYL